MRDHEPHLKLPQLLPVQFYYSVGLTWCAGAVGDWKHATGGSGNVVRLAFSVTSGYGRAQSETILDLSGVTGTIEIDLAALTGVNAKESVIVMVTIHAGVLPLSDIQRLVFSTLITEAFVQEKKEKNLFAAAFGAFPETDFKFAHPVFIGD